MWGPTENLGPICSVVVTFIGYKQTNKRKTDKQSINYKYINILKIKIKVPCLIYSLKVQVTFFIFDWFFPFVYGERKADKLNINGN